MINQAIFFCLNNVYSLKIREKIPKVLITQEGLFFCRLSRNVMSLGCELLWNLNVLYL
jgi:hypothetical protein